MLHILIQNKNTTTRDIRQELQVLFN